MIWLNLLFFLLLLFSLIFLIIGMINPKFALRWSVRQSRGTVLKFFVFCVFSFISGGMATSPVETKWWWVIVAALSNFLLLGYIADLRGLKPEGKGKNSAVREKSASKQKLTQEHGARQSKQPVVVKPNHKQVWNRWNRSHSSPDQITRQKRAYGCYIFSVDAVTGEGRMTGSGLVYDVSLASCTCFDFQKRHKPCKHMYRLAMELGLIQLPEFEPDEHDYTLN